MGLFSSFKNSGGSNNQFIERLKTADLELEENEDIVQEVESAIYDSVNEKHFDLLEAFIENVVNKEVASFMCQRKGRMNYFALCNFMNEWGVKNAIRKNDPLRIALENKSFFRLFEWASENKFSTSSSSFEGFYRGLLDGTYSREDARDENSIIFREEFYAWRSDLREPYIELDRKYRDKPEFKEKLFYKPDGTVRNIEYIMKDLENELEPMQL